MSGKRIKSVEVQLDGEETKMMAVIGDACKYGSQTRATAGVHPRPQDDPRPNKPYVRPEAKLFYCLKTAWRENPSTDNPVPLLELPRSVPDVWENVRYRLEQKIGLHDSAGGYRQTSFLCARQIVDFEDGSLAHAHRLSDADVLDEHSVIVLYRMPSSHGIGHYVPLDLLDEWRSWFDCAFTAQDAKHGRKTFGAQERDFHTRTHSRGRGGRWYRRKMLHASNYGDVPPMHWNCPLCQAAGDHWEDACTAPVEEHRVSIKQRKKIHGIPRSRLRQVDPESAEGRMATLQDNDGNIYVERPEKICANWKQNLGTVTLAQRDCMLHGVQEDERAQMARWAAESSVASDLKGSVFVDPQTRQSMHARQASNDYRKQALQYPKRASPVRVATQPYVHSERRRATAFLQDNFPSRQVSDEPTASISQPSNPDDRARHASKKRERHHRASSSECSKRPRS